MGKKLKLDNQQDVLGRYHELIKRKCLLKAVTTIFRYGNKKVYEL